MDRAPGMPGDINVVVNICEAAGVAVDRAPGMPGDEILNVQPTRPSPPSQWIEFGGCPETMPGICRVNLDIPVAVDRAPAVPGDGALRLPVGTPEWSG